MTEDVDVLIEAVDEDVVLGRVRVGAKSVEFMANITIVDRTMCVDRVHLDGAGPNTLGARALRAVMQRVMELLDVDEVDLTGGLRVTGASVGPVGSGPRTPKRLCFHREPP